MKFFAHVGFSYGEEDDRYFHVDRLHGPFEDDEAVARALKGYDKKERFVVLEGTIVEPPANPKEKPDSEKRKAGNPENYVPKPDGEPGYLCKDCGEEILVANVHHPVWIEGMGCAGTGEVRTTQAPYCPNCEIKPGSYGSPTTVSY